MEGSLLELLDKFVINRKRVVCIMSDCGADMVKLCKVLKVSHIPCLAHINNFLVEKLMASSLVIPDDELFDDDIQLITFTNKGDEVDAVTFNFVNMVPDVRAAVKELRTSTISDIFVLLQKELEESELSCILDCETRWNSMYVMVEGFCQLEKTITTFFRDRQCKWDQLKCLSKVLQPFFEITLKVQKEEIQNNFVFFYKVS